jgi:hypothetical protein
MVPAAAAAMDRPICVLGFDSSKPRIAFLGLDTEGGDRARINLLRAGDGVKLRLRTDAAWCDCDTLPFQRKPAGRGGEQWRISPAPGADVVCTVRSSAGAFTMELAVEGSHARAIQGIQVVFPFEPRTAAVTVLPSAWAEDGRFRLPAVLSAPDLGQWVMSASGGAPVTGTLEGSRSGHTLDMVIEMPPPGQRAITLSFKPLRLAAPRGLADAGLWRLVRRGWFNALQASARWGDPGNRFSAPPGILANNVLSDPVSCLISLWADHVLLVPHLAPGVDAPGLVRRTVDWWLDQRTRPTGEVVAYWDYGDMLDANASPIIAAWDYVEASGDDAWLTRRIGRLEFIADYLAARDIDDDGLVESTHSGDYGTCRDPMRTDSAYDTINSGHKNAYLNALAYRAFRCIADLEHRLRREERRKAYTGRADRLKAAYARTFLNPQTGWLAWWRSRDGELHDLSSPMISSLAICYGLVSPDAGRDMLDRLWRKMEEAGFHRFDLGVPITLAPVRRGDYLLGAGICGAPQREDGQDTFGWYLNGGCLVSDAVYFITALNIVGERDRADRILNAMLERQSRGVFANGGGFQNGVVNAYPQGAEFYTWDGKTCGYEGHLTYSFSFLQALLLREQPFRAKLLRPLLNAE